VACCKINSRNLPELSETVNTKVRTIDAPNKAREKAFLNSVSLVKHIQVIHLNSVL
jgi:hypothetical protein